jgi:hypothetical protein
VSGSVAHFCLFDEHDAEEIVFDGKRDCHEQTICAHHFRFTLYLWPDPQPGIWQCVRFKSMCDEMIFFLRTIKQRKHARSKFFFGHDRFFIF